MFKKIGITAVAGTMLIAAAPAAADTATCRLSGPMTVKHTPGHGPLVESGRIRLRSEGQISCVGTLGGQAVSTAPGIYQLRGWAKVREKCAVMTAGQLRLDAQVPKLISVWTEHLVETTADLDLLGPFSGASVSGIGAVAEQGLDIAGSASHATKPAGLTCKNGKLDMTLTLRDGAHRPYRSPAAPRSKPAPAQPSAQTQRKDARSKKAVRRCARKARTAKARRAVRRCRRAARR